MQKEEQERIEDHAVKCMGSQSSLHVPFTDEIRHNYLNPEGVNHVICTSKDARNLKVNPNFQPAMMAIFEPLLLFLHFKAIKTVIKALLGMLLVY